MDGIYYYYILILNTYAYAIASKIKYEHRGTD